MASHAHSGLDPSLKTMAERRLELAPCSSEHLSQILVREPDQELPHRGQVLLAERVIDPIKSDGGIPRIRRTPFVAEVERPPDTVQAHVQNPSRFEYPIKFSEYVPERQMGD